MTLQSLDSIAFNASFPAAGPCSIAPTAPPTGNGTP
jgi:hypothetical protein